jgi:hypothetical protein
MASDDLWIVPPVHGRGATLKILSGERGGAVDCFESGATWRVVGQFESGGSVGAGTCDTASFLMRSLR